MPIRMRAARRHYILAQSREYAPGEEFEVATEKEAERLVRIKRAARVEDAKPAARPADPAPGGLRKGYERRDMRPKGE